MLLYSHFPFPELLDLVYLRSRFLQRHFSFRLNRFQFSSGCRFTDELCHRRGLLLANAENAILTKSLLPFSTIGANAAQMERGSSESGVHVLLISGPGYTRDIFLRKLDILQPSPTTLLDHLLIGGHTLHITDIPSGHRSLAHHYLLQLLEHLLTTIPAQAPLVLISFATASPILHKALSIVTGALAETLFRRVPLVIHLSANSPSSAPMLSSTPVIRLPVPNGMSLVKMLSLCIGKQYSSWCLETIGAALDLDALRDILSPASYRKLNHQLLGLFVPERVESRTADDPSGVEREEMGAEDVQVVQLLCYLYQHHLHHQSSPPSLPSPHHLDRRRPAEMWIQSSMREMRMESVLCDSEIIEKISEQLLVVSAAYAH